MLLAIESSCDESAIALFSPQQGIEFSTLFSQIATHTRHGGVVPELAVREHLQKFPELMDKLPVPLCEVKKVAVTVGPGLVGSLAIGMSLARAIAQQKGIEIVGVNHLRGHAFSPFIDLHAVDPENFEQHLAQKLPHLGLLVSGGNTLLYEIDRNAEGRLSIEIVARTLDDAAGEALDKAAKMLGLGYPGGPLMEKFAKEAPLQRTLDFSITPSFKNDPKRIAFSFSGMKTALRYFLQKQSLAQVEANKPELAATFQGAVIESLSMITQRVFRSKRGGYYRSLGLCGGVAQNSALRRAFVKIAQQEGLPLMDVRPAYCGDNAAMIAFAAWLDPHGLLDVGSFNPGLTLDNQNL